MKQLIKVDKLPADYMQAPVKVGSKVVWVDGSYSQKISKDGYTLEMCHGVEYQAGDGYKELLTVVATNVPCPTSPCVGGSLAPANNCILKSQDGDIIFCSSINFRNIKKLGIHSVDMSDEQILRDLEVIEQ